MRLDAPPVVWFADDDERLAPEADLLVLMRNRQYLPRLGRFLQPDPNATGVAVQPSLAYGGRALPTPDLYVDLNSWAADGTSALAYALSDPVNNSDSTGLFGLVGALMTGLDTAQSTSDVFDQAYSGVVTYFGLSSMLDGYSFWQEYDVDWAMDWTSPDDDYSGAATFALSCDEEYESGRAIAGIRGSRGGLGKMSRAISRAARLSMLAKPPVYKI